jgi:hypothetical protein
MVAIVPQNKQMASAYYCCGFSTGQTWLPVNLEIAISIIDGRIFA